ncbi:DUF1905 domain-containing protein [bacterium]|nr:DUF1905 domain-containing protein [bacterium]
MQTFTGTIKQFPGKSGWFFVDVPNELVPQNPHKTQWGLIPADFKVGDTRWTSSLLPKGKGKYFIALKASVRKREDLSFGDTITIHFLN